MKANLRAVTVFGTVIVAACSSNDETTKKRGELVLAIDTDMTPGVDFDRIQIEIRQQGAAAKKETYREFGQPGQEFHFPATYTIVSNGNASTRIQLRVITGKVAPGGNPEVGIPQNMFEVVTTIPTDRAAMLRVRLEWLCRKSTKLEPDGYVEGACHEGWNCVAGECVDWNVDLTSLPPFTEGEVFGGRSRQGDGACFDTLGCLTGATAVTLDDACTFAAGDTSNLNVALVPAKDHGGICSGDVCFVPLDRGAPHGWVEQGGRVKIPKRVCELLKTPEDGLRLRGVVTTQRCPPKLPNVPTCGPWSTITTNRGSTSAEPPVGLSK
jgi:hypothetical protein